MNLLEAVITDIANNYVIDTKIEGLGFKRVIIYTYCFDGYYGVSEQLFDLEEEWQKEIYVGKKITVTPKGNNIKKYDLTDEEFEVVKKHRESKIDKLKQIKKLSEEYSDLLEKIFIKIGEINSITENDFHSEMYFEKNFNEKIFKDLLEIKNKYE